MLNAYEQRLIAFYLANAAASLHHLDREASDLGEWLSGRENRTVFGSRKRPSTIRAGKGGRDEGMSGGKWCSLQAALREEYSVTRMARPDRTAQRLRRLAKTTGLRRTDVDILELVLRYQTQPVVESMIDDVFRTPRRLLTPLNVQGPALSALLGVSANTVQARLRADAPLVRSGLVCVDSDGDLRGIDRLSRLAAAPAGSGLNVHRLLLDAATESTAAMRTTGQRPARRSSARSGKGLRMALLRDREVLGAALPRLGVLSGVVEALPGSGRALVPYRAVRLLEGAQRAGAGGVSRTPAVKSWGPARSEYSSRGKVSTGPAGLDVGKTLRRTGSPRWRAASAELASTHTHPAAKPKSCRTHHSMGCTVERGWSGSESIAELLTSGTRNV